MTTGTSGFQQRLGLFDATMLVAGSMIGSGIFIVSADISRDVGSSGWLLLIWVLTGVITIMGALSYAELAAMMPHAGGQYVYLREAYGPLWGFLYGWTFFLVIQTGFIAAVSVAFAKFLGVLVPELSSKTVLWTYPLGIDRVMPVPWLPEADWPTFFQMLEFKISADQFVAVGVTVVLTAINCLGVHAGKLVQNVFTVAKLCGLAALIVIGLTVAMDPSTMSYNFTDIWDGIWKTSQFASVNKIVPVAGLAAAMVVGGAMVGGLFSADSWNNVTFTAGETRDPKHNLPRSLALGTVIVIGLYLLANIAYLASLPIDTGIAKAPDDRVGTAVLQRISPRLGVTLMALTIMISTFGCVNGLVLAGARLYYAMAQDRLFFASVGRLSTRGVPAAGLVLQGLWSIVLIFSGTYNDLLNYIIFAALLFYVLTVSGLFVLRKTRPDAERPYKALGYPVMPAVYVTLCAFIMLDLLVVKPVYSWPSFIIVLAGIPVYYVWRQNASRRADAARSLTSRS
jgi:basic amino acid/polyamine antiporter, APA family